MSPQRHKTPCDGVQFGAFGKGVIFSVALQEGFFTREGINICYHMVAGSVQQFDTLESGGYDVISTAADNVINRVANLNKSIVMIAGTDLGPGFALGADEIRRRYGADFTGWEHDSGKFEAQWRT